MWNYLQLLLMVLLYVANYNRVNLATNALKANKAGLNGIFKTSVDANFLTKLAFN